jgi:hypothetical protein
MAISYKMPIWRHWLWNTGLRCAPQTVILRGFAVCVGLTRFPHPETGRGVDKSVLAVAAPRRYRNREHLRYVAQQACLVCGRKPSDPHHLRHVQPRALSRKPSDEFAVPLCRTHHRSVHRAGDEQAWWKQVGIDPIQVARRLWRQTRRSAASLQVGSRRTKMPRETPINATEASNTKPVSRSPP